MYRHGTVGGAEIVAHDPGTQRLFVVNREAHAMDVLDIHDPMHPLLYERVRVDPGDGEPTHVDVHNGIVAVALVAEDPQQSGHVVFFDVEGNELSRVEVGCLPDMLTFTPNGKTVVVACEGEPSEDYGNDPEGCICLIDISAGVRELTAADVTHLGFAEFCDPHALPPGMRILGKTSIAADLEPEYVAVSPKGDKAWAVLQENNALAIIDLNSRRIEKLIGLGYKDHSLDENGLDINDTDGGAHIRTWPILGMYQPDAIASFEHQGEINLITANEGDSRAYEGFNEEVLVEQLQLDPIAFPNAQELQKPENLGRLHTTRVTGDIDGDGDHDQIFAYGGRSFSIWTAAGEQIYDSGDQLERLTAEIDGEHFNSDQSVGGGLDQRSDDRGPEPECVDVGEVNGRRYAFIGLERIGGVMAFDISDPRRPFFVNYVNTVAVSGDGDLRALTDSAPEGVRFISAADSPTGKALLAVAFEVSGTTRLYELKAMP
jgi:hypothetical protein